MVVTDMDGTLLDASGSRVSPRNVRALQRAEDAGARVVIATGRPIWWLTPVLEAGFTGIAVCMNGAVVYDIAAGEIISGSPMTSRGDAAVRRRADPAHRRVRAGRRAARHRPDRLLVGGDVQAPVVGRRVPPRAARGVAGRAGSEAAGARLGRVPRSGRGSPVDLTRRRAHHLLDRRRTDRGRSGRCQQGHGAGLARRAVGDRPLRGGRLRRHAQRPGDAAPGPVCRSPWPTAIPKWRRSPPNSPRTTTRTAWPRSSSAGSDARARRLPPRAQPPRTRPNTLAAWDGRPVRASRASAELITLRPALIPR